MTIIDTERPEIKALLNSVLEEHHAGPQTGVFTDGCSIPNPGPGGWGLVYVRDGKIAGQKCGHEPQTTNNRMEMTAIIEAFRLIGEEPAVTIYSDSNLCVQTVNEWAANWERRGWKKKTGEIMNLDLVKEVWALHKKYPQTKLEWIKAHNGWLWNEYADALANAWTV